MREPRTSVGRYYALEGFTGDPDQEPLNPILSVIRAAAEGVLPLVIVVALGALFWEASVIARIFALPYGIDMVQRAEAVTAGGGLVVTVVVFFISLVRTLQGVREHQRYGYKVEAYVTLGVLAVVSLIVLYPVLAAMMAPQNPAP